MEETAKKGGFFEKIKNFLSKYKGQLKIGLTVLCIVLLLAAVVRLLFVPVVPRFVYQTLSRFCLSVLDTSDNGVSDYYPVQESAGEYENFALSVVPDVPECYTFAADYVKFLNRNCGVKTVLLNISAEAAELLNSGMDTTVEDRYFDLTYGTYYASREFEDFVTDISLLNSALLPGEKIKFAGIAEGAVDGYKAAGNGTLLICSRSEAHGEGSLCDELRNGGCEFLLTDILCSNALTSSESRYSDIIPPFLSEGTYIFSMSKLNWVKKYYEAAMSVSKKNIGGFSAIAGPEGDFCIIVAGSTDEELAEGLF